MNALFCSGPGPGVGSETMVRAFGSTVFDIQLCPCELRRVPGACQERTEVRRPSTPFVAGLARFFRGRLREQHPVAAPFLRLVRGAIGALEQVALVLAGTELR